MAEKVWGRRGKVTTTETLEAPKWYCSRPPQHEAPGGLMLDGMCVDCFPRDADRDLLQSLLGDVERPLVKVTPVFPQTLTPNPSLHGIDELISGDDLEDEEKARAWAAGKPVNEWALNNPVAGGGLAGQMVPIGSRKARR